MNKFLKLIGVGCFVGLMLVACSKQDASPEIDDAKIAAATKGYDDLEPAIKKELDNLKLSIRKKDPTEEELRANVEENVHFQVAEGLKEYKDLVSKKELMVVGAVYDVRGEYGRGAGKIYFTNVNGEKDQKVLDEFIQRIKKHPSPVSN